jgi:hypothetical protein
MLKLITAIAFLMAFTNSPHIDAAQLKTRITGIYSTFEYLEEAGDVGGLEVFIVVTNKGYHAVIQDSPGYPGIPVVVPVDVNGDNVKFKFKDSAGEEQIFEGRVSANALSGILNGEKYSLPRKKSYWQ